MKVELEKHISEVLSALQIVGHFEVFDCRVDVMPEWANQIPITHEFLISFDQLSNREKLSAFLQKEIFKNGDRLYWFDGKKFEKEVYQDTFSNDLCVPPSVEIEYLKTETRLPQWLDNLIFNELKAEYAPDFRRFESNLDLDRNENLKYLGTYFPRSYAESFCIFDNIFQNKHYRKEILQKDHLNILSIGCGTGGDLIGLITIIEKYCPKNSTINIWALDGNEEALFVLEKIIERFSLKFLRNIKLKTIKSCITSIAQISIQEINRHAFDFIISFKMLCEVIAAGKGRYDNSYYEFVHKFIPMLSDKGLCVLLDVTTKTEHNNIYNPILKNEQVNQALRELANYRTLLPLSCNKNERICSEQCFTQQKIYISHSQRNNDISKVSYRVIARTMFVNELVTDVEDVEYVLQRNGKAIEKICPYSCGQKIVDSYKLNK